MDVAVDHHTGSFGHQLTRNAALPFGSRVRLDADNAALYLLEPVAV